MTGTPRIEILLATCNGARFLGDQLDSLLAQTERSIVVIACDDCSDDNTAAILATYAARHPDFLKVIAPPAKRLGPCGNFGRLLDIATADYIMFCDQDDVWLPDKVADSLARMLELERDLGRQTPLLVHTDLAVVDADLVEIEASLATYSGSNPRLASFAHLLIGNVAAGCTIMANRALFELARPIPPDALMHDHWLAQVAAGMGRISYIDRATMLYRQHGGNTIGAQNRSVMQFRERVARVLLNDRTLRVYTAYVRIAAILMERYAKRLDQEKLTQARTLCTIWQRNRAVRFALLYRVGLRKPTIIESLGMLLVLLRTPRANGHD